MTEQSPVSIDDVRALVAERHRFDEWLNALEARRDSTPEHVYTRVHGDYEARRSQVMTSLHAHVPGLEQLLANLDTQAGELGELAQGEEDERAEAMLRHAVGEYDDTKWNEVRERVEASLASLTTERGALDAQREDVRMLLERARPEVVVEETVIDLAIEEVAEVPAPIEDSAPSLDSIDVTPDMPMESSRTGVETPDWLGSMTPTSVSSLGDLSDITSEPIGSSEKADEFELTVNDEAPPASTPPSGIERPSIWGARESGVPSHTSEEEKQRSDSVDVFGDAKTGQEDASGVAPDAGASQAGAFDELAFLRSVIDPQAPAPPAPRAPGTGDAQKTLRCTECGTMNLPTEWYCERCGGELAAF
jgi:hypothetical protein